MITNTRSGLTIINRMTCLAAALLLTIGCTGDQGRQGPLGPSGADGADGPQGEPGPAGPQGPAGAELDPTLSTWDKALAGIGGQTALDALVDFQIEASGVRHVAGEGFSVHDPAATVSTFDTTLTYNVAMDAFRVDWARSILFLGGVPLTYSEIVNQQLGYVEGDDSFFGPALSTTDMPSSRWAAVRKQTMLLNPHIILQAVGADPSIASEGGAGLHNGAIHEILVVQDPTGLPPLNLWINASTGRLAKISTLENDHLHRDVTLEAFYTDWKNDENGGVAFPLGAFIAIDGEIVHEEYRTTVTINPGADATTYDFPGGASPVYDDAVALWGMASHQWHQGFAALGLPFDAPQTFVQATEIAPGYWYLTGGSHHSVMIEQANGLVLLEAPLYEARSQAIITWADTQFPGKLITHVMITHHHHDHSAGARAFVRDGATIILGAPSAEAFAEIFRAPSTVWPDELAITPVPANIWPVPRGGSVTVDDATNPVEIHHFPNFHSDDALLGFAPTQNMVFESDLFNPGPDVQSSSAIFPAAAQELLDGIIDSGIYSAGLTVVGGHGGASSVSVLEAYIAANQP